MPVSIVFYPFTAQAVRSQYNSSRPRPDRHSTPSSSIDQFCFCFILHPGAPLWSPELHILSAMIINSPSLSPVSGASIFSEWSHYCTGDSLRLRSPLSPVCCHSPAPRTGPVTNQSGCLCASSIGLLRAPTINHRSELQSRVSSAPDFLDYGSRLEIS